MTDQPPTKHDKLGTPEGEQKSHFSKVPLNWLQVVASEGKTLGIPHFPLLLKSLFQDRSASLREICFSRLMSKFAENRRGAEIDNEAAPAPGSSGSGLGVPECRTHLPISVVGCIILLSRHVPTFPKKRDLRIPKGDLLSDLNFI